LCPKKPGPLYAEVRAPAFDLLEASRGSAFGDLDRDGDIDLGVSNSNAPARLLLNQTDKAGSPSLTIRLLRKQAGLPVEGTRVAMVRKGHPTVWRMATATGSYLSANEPAVHFGLPGGGAAPDHLVVHWPEGARQRVNRVPAKGGFLRVREMP